MPADIDAKILKRLLDKGLLQLDELAERGVVEESAIDRMMEEILAEERESSLGQEDMIAFSSEGVSEAFSRYKDLELLAEGGMAKVYKAYDPELKRNVALKFLRIDDAKLKERLLREARAQAGIDHPNICKVYEVGELGGRPYIAMQHLAGITLKEAADHLGLEEKVVLIKQVAESLQEAHRLGLIHRDIKPSNIMVEANASGQWIPYLVDFGLARQMAEAGETLTDFIVGTPSYMSPEQAAGRVHSLDRRSDIYSLGVTFYELLSDQLPYKQSDTPMIQSVITEEAIRLRKRNPSVPSDLETIVMKCLEKGPERRYDSARALADDLQRYLNGEPILAKPARLSYRLLKRAKKNKIAAAIFSVAVLITLMLTGMLVWIEWRSGQQTKYANEFNQEVRFIESMMRSVYMAPLHDIRSELANAKRRLVGLEQRISQADKYAYGPGHNALGHGYLVLREYEKARHHLENAWQSGYRESSTAYALGQVMGFLYQRALVEAEQITSKELREIKKHEIEKTYRAPAVSFLKTAVGHVESPAYVEGLLALYEKRYQEALVKAAIAYSHASWSYEAKKLEADVLTAMGKESQNKGNFDQAMKSYKDAGKAYQLAIQAGRSDQEVYLGECNRYVSMMDLQVERGINPNSVFERVLDACNQAISIKPDNDEGYERKSWGYLRLAKYQMYNSPIDPRPALIQSIQFGTEAVKRNHGSSATFRDIGISYITIAEYEVMNGRDPQLFLTKSMQQFQQALLINPNDAVTLLNLGNVYLKKGEFLITRGEDPRPTLLQGIQYYRKSIQSSSSFGAYNNAGIVYQIISEYELAHGTDPISNLDKAIEQYQKALQINSSDVYASNNVGTAYLTRAYYQYNHGSDPKKSFDQAIQYCQKALEINPKYSVSYYNLGLIYFHFGQYLLKHGENPLHNSEVALKYWQESLEINPTYVYASRDMALGYLLLAEFEIMQGKNPGYTIREAIKRSQKTFQISPEDGSAFANIGFAYKWAALYALQQDKDPTANLRMAREALRQALAVDSNSFEAYRSLGHAELIAARWAIKTKLSPDVHFKSAEEAFRKSIELNSQELESYVRTAELYRWEAEWKQDHFATDSAGLSIRTGLDYVQKALRLSQVYPEAIALEGAMHVLEAHQEGDPSVKAELGRQAQALLERALKMSSFLKREYDPLLKQAINIAGADSRKVVP